MLLAVADLRAFPKINCQMQAPALNGACDQCHIQGCRHGNTTIYFGHYRYSLHVCQPIADCAARSWLPLDHEFRQEMKQYLFPDEMASSTQGPPARRSHAGAMRAARESQDATAAGLSEDAPTHPSKRNGRKRIDVFSATLDYWDR